MELNYLCLMGKYNLSPIHNLDMILSGRRTWSLRRFQIHHGLFIYNDDVILVQPRWPIVWIPRSVTCIGLGLDSSIYLHWTFFFNEWRVFLGNTHTTLLSRESHIPKSHSCDYLSHLDSSYGRDYWKVIKPMLPARL